MATRRTVDLLPEIFRTPTNKQFLSATLDQLTQEPRFKRTQGFVGRRVGPGVDPADNYVIEPTAERANYQLEPGVVFLRPNTNQVEDAITYPGLIDSIEVAGADTQRQDQLWRSEYYAWDPFCDLDKFTNYSQYYWLSQGPDPVDVGQSEIAITDDFTVTRSSQSYSFTGLSGSNPTITLVRGGNYEFTVNQPGHGFWIQAAPGVSGTLPATPNISSRDVFGVQNNGAASGVVRFNVPQKTAQDFYYGLADIGTVDLITKIRFDQINNVYVDEFLAQRPDGIDGITNLDQRTVVFDIDTLDAALGGWQINTQYDPLPRADANNGQIGSFDTTLFDQTTDITSQAQRYSIWRISYVNDSSGRPFMQLDSIAPIPTLSKFRIIFGTQGSSTNWFKNASGFIEQIPLLTAIEDTLWYQDSTNPEIFGRIRLVDSSTNTPLDIEEIIGAKTFTSPNGVTFTNGLKVQFRGPTTPSSYEDQEFYVEGVGTGSGIDARVGFVDGEAYFGEFHTVGQQKITGRADSDSFQQFIYDTVEESLVNFGAGGPDGAALPTQSQFGAANGNGIRLIPVQDFVTPETYTRSDEIPFDSTTYDSTPYDAQLNAPLVPDYITINRASRDRNAWSRSNRWFHLEVIRATAEYNNLDPVLDQRLRAKRPIIEFRANMDLWNSGTQGIAPINVIDFEQTDALSNVNGTTGYGVDGFELLDGSRIIFAADRDPAVRNRVYTVEFIRPDGNPNTPLQINLVPAASPALINQVVVCLNGVTRQGQSFWFDGVTWTRAQQKNSVNQPPLFDIHDAQGRSFGDRAVYASSDFQGTRLFGYAVGTSQISDEVLGFALQYQNLNNVGDILFENYFYTDTFQYVQDTVGVTESVSAGFVRQYIDRVSFSSQLGWQAAATESESRQIFRFVYDGSDLVLDVPVDLDAVLPPVQMFVQGIFIDPNRYTVRVQGLNTFVSLAFEPDPGTVIEVQVLSPRASPVAFYQVPINLSNNPLNLDSNRFSLGTIRTQYESIGQNLRDLRGPIVGSNNTRDLGNIIPYGDVIVQHSSPLTLAGAFLRDPEFNMMEALTFNDREYNKYKAQLIDLAARGDFVNLTPTQILDSVMQEISVSRSENSPFYWSDMIPAGDTFTETAITVTPITTPTFDTQQIYDFDMANYRALLVFVNGELLTRTYDYVTGDDTPTVTVLRPLAVGDRVVIREYTSTVGSFVPNTPTKLGLYPAYRPEIFLDETYVDPTLVIRGHDGSITVSYGDARDEILLEFETRIFNNLKVPQDVPMPVSRSVPGQFRDTGYSTATITEILSQDFLSWVGWNKLDYITQNYDANNAFTFNYSQSGNKLDGQPLLGAWRGIYLYLYDTLYPNTRPWEMLGFSQEPIWWQSEYGPAPYTSGNLVLWEDLAAGLVRDPLGAYVLPQYRRPGLTEVIPAGSEGELLDPLQSCVGRYDATSFRRSWTFGDDGPTENAWRTSSSWPFAVMRLLLLTRPAEFFSLNVDRDRYRFDRGVAQWLWDQRYRLDANQLAPIYGSGVSKSSYINWIVDYNRQQGTDSSQRLTTRLSNLDVRLCWRTAAFTDKQYLKIFAERATPTGSDAGLLLPDESYQILLYRNQAFDQATYSSVIVQRTDDGWAVFGYNATHPYFSILVSRAQGTTREIRAGGTAVRVSTQYSNRVARIPYGYVFRNQAAVCDFLLSYGEVLRRQGFVFEGIENGLIMNWDQMANEFLYWSNQGWITGSVINLNPGATRLSVTRTGAVAESLVPARTNNLILDQNRLPIPPAQLAIEREDNTFRVSTLSSNTINYLNLRMTAYEHLVVLDNRSIFADLLYDPATGARQSRVRVAGVLSADWNGTVNAPGFVINEDNVRSWRANQKYAKGEIVQFKDQLYVASTIIEPSQEFNYTSWVKTDQDQIQVGLLPNAANASDQLANAYSVYQANLEQEIDLFSFGLIGFRSRDYMTALDLGDVSQVNLYRQFIDIKGTRQSAELFSLADLGKESAEYNIYEYWALLQSTYGANANRSFIEILLDRARLVSDPSVIQVIQPGQVSQADQTVELQDLWRTSYRLPDTDILPTTNVNVTDTSLPVAGYVNLDDVDVTMFDINNPVALADDLDNLGVGTRIWVAKVNAYDWNVYQSRAIDGVVLEVSDNLDGLSLVTFSRAHGLTVGDTMILKFFAADIDGVYRVVSVPSIYSILIPYTFVGQQTQVTGQGLAFRLDSLRFAQPADIAGLDPGQLVNVDFRVWVDRDANGNWTVLEKTFPWETAADLVVPPPAPPENSEFGDSVAQGFFNLTALVGAPGYNADNDALAPGAVYAFGLGSNNELEFNSIIAPNILDLGRFGDAIDIGNQTWAVVGAPDSVTDVGYAVILNREPGSDAITTNQVLVANDTDTSSAMGYGTAVTLSRDERYIYVGAPDVNTVYAYGRVDVQPQRVDYVTDGVTNTFNWAEHILLPTYSAPLAASYPQQINVVLDSVSLQFGTEWTVVGDNVVLTSTPTQGQSLSLIRRQVTQLDSELYANVAPAVSTSASGSDVLFNVQVLRGTYVVTVASGGTNYEVGDTLTILGTQLGGSSPANDLTITVTAPVGPIYRATLTAGLSEFIVNDATGITIGQELVKISGDGAWASSPVTVTGVTDNEVTVDVAASVDGFVRFYATPNSVTTFTQSGSPALVNSFVIVPELATVTDIYSFRVEVNEEIYRPFFDYDYNSTTGTLTFTGRSPALGSVILVTSSDYFTLIGTLSPGVGATDRFGAAVTTTTNGRYLLVGSPGYDQNRGQVFAYNRSWERFVVSDTAATTFAPLMTLGAVTNVSLNGQPLSNSRLNLDGGFSVDLGANTVTISVPLAVGDTVEIDAGQFTLVEQFQSATPFQDAEFGASVDQCINDCSLYVSAPRDGAIVPQGGLVEFYQNQAGIYGTITSTSANPVLTAGEYLYVNGVSVQCTGTTVQQLVTDINNSLAPNVHAAVSADLVLTGDGSTRVFDIGTIYSAASSYNTVIYQGVDANNVTLLTPGIDYVYNNATQTVTFTAAPFANAYILVVSGRITISAANLAAATPFDLVSVAPVPADGLFADLGFDIYIHQQTIRPPVPQDYARFGTSIMISDDTTSLVIGAPNGSMIRPTEIDDFTTQFDANSTTFSDTTLNSGAVYIYNQLSSYQASAINPSQFVYGQQIINNGVRSLDRYGQSVDLTTGILLSGAPGNDLGDSSGDFGTVFQSQNVNAVPAWQVLRQQQPVVDVNLLNSLYIYDVGTAGVTTYLDFFDPLQGKLLGAVRQNLDYIGAVNPAQFNVGSVNNRGETWGATHVGELWWDTTNCRFIDPNQDDVTYASRRWGQVFPGSRVEVFEWVASPVPPTLYAGPGRARSTTSYSVRVDINDQGIFEETYYFWVQDTRQVARDAGKTLSATVIAQYIENPRSSGIAYVAPINASTVALYNSLDDISDTNSALHIEYDREANDNAVHQQYQLIADGRGSDFLSATLYRKFLDSMAGTDTTGNAVPDAFLPPSELYGVSFRPRQSLFVDRFGALQNYLTTANTVLTTFPAAERRSSALLNSAEPEPAASSGQWDLRVADQIELSYQNLDEVDAGYRYLVVTDSSNQGLWAIYEVQVAPVTEVRVLSLVRVQNFDTRRYWQYVDWYLPGYDPQSRILVEVANTAGLETLTVPAGSSVKVTSDAQGRWEIYLRLDTGWQRVGLQSGTIQFSETLWNYSVARFGFDSEVFDAQRFDQAPNTETRQIIRAINEELFIDDLDIERNRLLMLMFDYITSEQISPSWLTKTSLIDVDHIIRELEPFQLYRQDNQDFVLDYIKEVKPYHTQIRDFNLIYRGSDSYLGTLTDFDVPAFWDSQQQLFISPILDDGSPPVSTTSSVPSTSEIWQSLPYNQWFQNYLLGIESVAVIDGGSGYTVAPQVLVQGTAQRAAKMTARINSAGQVIEITVQDPGAGYVTTAELVLEGGNGEGARAVARMGNSLVRDISTVIKYDRYQYASTILTWQAGTAYTAGTRVRFDDRVWQATTDLPAQQQFDTDFWQLVPAGSLSGVDRTMGYYVPSPTEPGLDLALLISGVDYPGVQVSAPRFDQNTGFDIGRYDINPFDNLAFSPEGFPSYDPEILDVIYESEFDDSFLGVNPTTGAAIPDPRPGAIEVSGGAFVDTYSSHAPEELVPGAVFDTLDFRVFTTPGSDWQGDGHGFPIATTRITFDDAQPVIAFGGLMQYPITVLVFNSTLGSLLTVGINYSVDWVAGTVTISTGVSTGNIVTVVVAALGGGDQLFTQTEVGNGVQDTVLVPRSRSDIDQMIVFVNGVQVFNFSLTAVTPGTTAVIFDTPLTSTQRATLTGLGDITAVGSWSLPVTQLATADGSSGLALTNSLQGTNPANIVVVRNGIRATPAAGQQYTADGSTDTFLLPDSGGYSLDLVAENDVAVYVNNDPLILGVDFVVDAFDISSLERTVTLTDTPAPGATVLISVRTGAQYFVVGNNLQFRASQGFSPQLGDALTVITWNDTADQDILTRVYVGPTEIAVPVSEGYDQTPFDQATVNNDPGSFDFSQGLSESVNRWDLGRTITNEDRLLVTLDGRFLEADIGYIIQGTELVIPGAVINSNQTVAVTMFTNTVVPGAIAFRIFQDMRGLQTLYRITTDTSTRLAQPLTATGDVITVDNAGNMPEPDLAQGIFGLITINGERIAYRVRDVANNQLSGLRRGTAGTAAADHATGSAVYTINASNALPLEYQNRFVQQDFLGNGSQTAFLAPDIDIDDLDSSELVEAVQVFVGGILQTVLTDYEITAVTPLTVTFVQAPASGYQVRVRILRSQSIYQAGDGTASNGVALQETNTEAARFIRGI